MSQTSKRPGARDISDLKARLGLKKTGGQPAVQPGGPVPPPPGGGVPPPGGFAAPAGIAPPPGIPGNTGSSIPAPPGLSLPQQATNPFAAPAHARIAPAADFVIVNDGKPVESVSKQNRGASFVKVAAMVLAPLVAGVVIGKVASSAAQHNKVIADAAPIHDDVVAVRRGLTELQAALDSNKQGGKFVPGDEKLTEALAAVPAITGDYELVYTSSMYHLDSAISREIFTFYSDIQALNTKLKEHVRASKLESKILKEGAVKLGSFAQVPYGAILKIPSGDDAAAGTPVTFKIVQLGDPVCEGETKPNPAGCPGPPIGFAYREDETSGPWKVIDMAPATEAAIPTDRMVRLDRSTKVLKQIITGAEATVAEIAYTKRIDELAALTEQMLATGKKIEIALNAKAQEDGKFSFFL